MFKYEFNGLAFYFTYPLFACLEWIFFFFYIITKPLTHFQFINLYLIVKHLNNKKIKIIKQAFAKLLIIGSKALKIHMNDNIFFS